MEYCSRCHRVIKSASNIKWVLGLPYGQACGELIEETHRIAEERKDDPSYAYQDDFLLNSEEDGVKVRHDSR